MKAHTQIEKILSRNSRLYSYSSQFHYNESELANLCNTFLDTSLYMHFVHSNIIFPSIFYIIFYEEPQHPFFTFEVNKRILRCNCDIHMLVHICVYIAKDTGIWTHLSRIKKSQRSANRPDWRLCNEGISYELDSPFKSRDARSQCRLPTLYIPACVDLVVSPY